MQWASFCGTPIATPISTALGPSLGSVLPSLKRGPCRIGNPRKTGAFVMTPGVPVIILSVQTWLASNGVV